MKVTQLLPSSLKSWIKGLIIETVESSSLLNTSVPKLIIKTVESSSLINTYVPYMVGQPTLTVPKASNDRKELAVPPPELWLGYGPTADAFLASGKNDVRKMRQFLSDAGYSPAPGDRVLDFGCGAGRMIRWLADISTSCEIWGADILAENIRWCQQNLHPPFNFVTTTTMPHLPFEDRFFNLIYCGSVFTHIGDLADCWLLELRRILAPGGRAYLTIHDRHTLELLQTPEYANSYLAQVVKDNPDLFENFGILALDRWREKNTTQIFYDVEYFKSSIQPMFRVLSVIEEAYGYQTAVIVERR